MSDLARFLISLSQDATEMEAFTNDPELLLAGADLSPEDKAVLRSGDVEAIYQRLGEEKAEYSKHCSMEILPPPKTPKGPKPPAPKPPKPKPPVKRVEASL
jgi:hypothetical protein